jgi:UDP-GlcNAc:polypeptide alpha-N-acetylglucosaminyltransferase
MRDYHTANLLKRPLRGTRRRSMTRRQKLLVLLLVVLCVSVFVFAFLFTTSTTTEPTQGGSSSGRNYALDKPWLTQASNASLFTSLVAAHTPGTAWRDPSTNSIVAYAKSGTLLAIKPTIRTRHRRATADAPATFRNWESLYAANDSYNIPAFATPRDRDTLQHASIFTSLASFRDRECATTLRDLFEMALAPHRLYVGISEERTDTDISCLSPFEADGVEPGMARRLLYGADAPADVRVELRQLTWADVIFPRTIVDVDAAAEALNSTSVAPHPAGIFLHPSYAEERLSCVAGELETLRDRLLLHEDDVRREASGGTVFRQGRGGPQQQPSRALAGCRVTTRVTRPELARGPTFGRYITSLFFFDQDYFMVVDSHTRFSVHWDAKLITRIFQLPTPGVLSYYPNGYREKDERREYGKQDFMLMCTAQVLSNGMPKLGARWMPVAKHPLLQGFAAAGFMFGDAQYVLDTPFDPFLPYMFDGEEVLFSARMWTAGWDIYGPAESNVFHNYERYDTPKYFGIMGTTEVQLRALSERRTLYLLRRAQPWVQELVTRGYMTADGQQTLKPLPPVEPPESRLIVSDDVAAATPEIHVWKSYYGMGAVRTLGQYWEHTELTDAYVKKKDSENRWMGGVGMCKGGR